ncbi:signal peptidase II [Eionea flava]
MLNVWLSKMVLQLNQQIKAPQKKVVWFGMALFILCADQVTKVIASDHLALFQSVEFLPYFNFTLLHNYGAAFSFLSDAGGWQRIFLGAVAFVVSLFLVVWILCAEPTKKIEITGLSLVLGGAVGNLWDRIYLGYVVDFIDWFYVAESSECIAFFYPVAFTQTCHWPAFNIADAAIMLGAACLIVDMLFFAKPDKS